MENINNQKKNNIMYKRETLYYPYKTGTQQKILKVEYTLWFEDDKLVEVRNEGNFCIDKKSECWSYFNNRYNK